MRGIKSEWESRQRRQDQREATDVVMNEQLLQQSEEATMASRAKCPEVIAMLYHLLSFSNQRRALERGLYDAAAVYGSNTEYQMLGATKNALFESHHGRDSESMLVDEGIMKSLMAKENCSGHASVEDWLFERYQKGQRVARSFSLSNHAAESSLEDVSMTD